MSISFRSFAAATAITIAGLVYFAIPHDAESQINGRITGVPDFSRSTEPHINAEHVTVKRAKLAHRPVQVAMPAPPPIKIFPGLEEPLVATGPVTDAENKDLDAALQQFHDLPLKLTGPNVDYSDYSRPLLDFVNTHKGSNWNPGLLLDLGLGYYHAGYYSKAFTEFELSWQSGRNATSYQARRMVDRAVGELARMHARVGHAKELEALFKDIGNRPIGGPATELLQGAREALWSFHHNPAMAYLCGPQALKNLLITLKADPKDIAIADEARSGPHGFSLAQLAKLADKTKLKYKLIYRTPGQPVPVPSVVNWNVHHYAAITSVTEGHYLIMDPTFAGESGGDMTQKALDAEASGYFLVPESVMAANPNAGWRTLSAKSQEAKAVYGMGNVSNTNSGVMMACSDMGTVGVGIDPFSYKSNEAPATENCDSKTTQHKHTCPLSRTSRTSPMTTATVTPLAVNLHLMDTPVGYRPQIGVPNLDKITYNQREDLQPATFSYSNLSPKWSHSWQSVFTDVAHALNVSGTRLGAGGGGYKLGVGHYNTTTGAFDAETPDYSVTYRDPPDPHTWVPRDYHHDLPDGSSEIFATSNGATSGTRLWFLTSVVDPQGNTTTINYDTSYRITSVVDAMGRSTTFTYGLTAYPLLITAITDPFGRSATFTYDTSARLSTITDPLGITSTFTYDTSEPTFVKQLDTPYGTSTFNDTPNPNDPSANNTRSLTLTDPLGNTDFYYFYQDSTTPSTDASALIPVGMLGTDNTYLNWRNTYHWNPHEWAVCATDPTTPCQITSGVPQQEDFDYAALTHWLHVPGTGLADRGIGSVKQPLENRVFFNYPGQTGTTNHWYNNGTLDLPSYTGRVLDAPSGTGATQLSTATYNTLGNITSRTDPKGRTTQYNYDTNNIDLLTVQQLTAPSTYTTIATYGSYNTPPTQPQHVPYTYTGPDGQTWNYTYTTAGQLKTVTDPNSNVTTYNYDTSGRLSTIVDANSTTILTLTYDSADRVQTRTDSEGYTLTYDYDDIDRITQITYPDGTTDQYDYDFQSGPYSGTPSLELRKYTDRLGRVTTYGYDADRRLTSVTEPTTSSTTRTTNYDYYEDGTLKDIIDANGNDTHWDIDIESRPTAKTYQYGTGSAQTETYTWESHGGARLSSITDALGQVKTFSYDTDDRILGLTYTSTVNTTPNVTFSWDTYFPRLSSMTDGLGTTNYSYTAVGTNGALQLSSIDGPYSNDTISLSYDAIGRLSGRNISGGNETFGYDAINRLTSHGTPLGSFTIGYLGETGQISSQSVTNGSTTVSTGWSYDTNTNDRRLIGITNSGVSRSYTIGYGSSPVNVYDIMSITDTAASGHPWSTQSRAYTYDYADRLLTASSTTPGNDTYAYDDLDNATTYNTPGTGSLSPTYNGFNQLATFGTNTYSYDADGNTLSGDGTKTYKWDAENRLIEIDYAGGSDKSVFSYDGMGHRTVDAETVSGTTTTTRYLWCGSHICQTRDGSDTVLRRDLDEGEYNASTSQKLVYMPDQLGSVRDVLDGDTGNLVQSYDYTPYGAEARTNGSTPTDYQYARLFYHQSSGVNLASYRAMDGITGRWLKRDPIRELGAINLYAYVEADPISLQDLLGLDDNPEDFGISGELGMCPYGDTCSVGSYPFEVCMFNCIVTEKILGLPKDKWEDKAEEYAQKRVKNRIGRSLAKRTWHFIGRLGDIEDLVDCYDECKEKLEGQ